MNLPEAVHRFRRLYPASSDPKIWRAPGRVNLIGEHTDYNLGLVMPMAIDLACHVISAASGDACIRAYSQQFDEAAEWPLQDVLSLRTEGRWTDRVVAVAWELLHSGVPITGHNLLIDSTVPLGSGLSSSAALGVSLTLALGGRRPAEEVARLARAAETDFVGVPCGIMDQFVSANGQDGMAILLDCRTLAWRPIKLPNEIAIVAANSMIKHELASSAYGMRVSECAAAARVLGVATLRDARLDQIEVLDPVLRKRARHVLTENARVEAFAAAAIAGDIGEMGRLITESHRSLRDDYEVSSPELDFLVHTALRVPGVLGSRMIGGGFGGSTVSLMRPEAVELFRTRICAEYRRFRDVVPETHICMPSSGASEVLLWD